MRTVALGVRFLLELCLLASFATWAAQLPLPLAERVAVGVVACLAAAAVWGLLLSPRRRLDFPAPVRLVLEAAYFLAAAAALLHVGAWRLAMTLLVVAVADRIALALLPERGRRNLRESPRLGD